MNLDWLHVHQLKLELWVWHLKPLTVIGLLPAVSIWSQIVQTFTKNPEAKLQKVRNWCHWAKKKNSVAIFMTDSMNSLGKFLQIFPLDFTGSLFVTIDIYPIHPLIWEAGYTLDASLLQGLLQPRTLHMACRLSHFHAAFIFLTLKQYLMLLMTALNKAVSESHYLPQIVLREVLDLRHRMDAYLAMTKPSSLYF